MTRLSAYARATTTCLVLLLWSATAALAAVPTAQDDYAVATDRYLETVGGVETYSILIDVLANDQDADGDPLQVVITGDVGGEPADWTPSPIGTVQYLGDGLFDLTFVKSELGDATEITFQYELEGGTGPATVHVTVSNEGPPVQVIAQPDTFTKSGDCWLRLPVLQNDTNADRIQSFNTGSSDMTVEFGPEKKVLILRGMGGGQLTYVAEDSRTGATSTPTTVIIDDTGNPFDFLPPKITDCFERPDGTLLGGQTVGYFYDNEATWPTWTAAGVSHLDKEITLSSPVDGTANVRRKGYVPFDADSPQWTDQGYADELRGTFKADPGAAEWGALAFTRGTGSVLSEAELWLQLDFETGELTLHGESGETQPLAQANPTDDGYPFLSGGYNHVRLQYAASPTDPEVDVWINGVHVFNEVPYPYSDAPQYIENAGYFINYGSDSSNPGDVSFDDFELRVGQIIRAIIRPGTSDPDQPDATTDIENGATVDMGPVHLGCTPAHTNCHAFRQKSLVLTNEGNAPLEVSNLSFITPTAWSLVSPQTDSFSVAPGDTAEIVVQVDALELGNTVSRLELSTNDEDLGHLLVNFTADVTQAPIADFVYSCDGTDCIFDGGGSSGENLTASSFRWLIDGQTVSLSGSVLDHTFPSSGSHTVALLVTDATEAQHGVQRTVSIVPEASFTAACANDSRVCDFDAGISTSGVSSYHWELGDGSTLDGNGSPEGDVIRHTYATSGRYSVSLKLTDGDGQTGFVIHEVELTPVPDFAAACTPGTRTCDFDASASTPGMVAYSWQLGDGQITDGVLASHTYGTSGVYPVTLTVVDPSGQVEAVSKLVPLAPVSVFTAQCDPEAFSCSFDSTGSTPDTVLSWDFGDGSPAGASTVESHEYGMSGVFAVTLSVTDGSGQTASSSQTVTFPPVARFSVSCDSLSCQFDASTSSPGVSSYAWSFGDEGAADTGADPTHEYPDGGDYTVTLTVADGSGQTATDTQTLSVVDENLLFLILSDRR